MGNIWFTSDWYFGHNKDFIYKNRGFSSIEEMNEIIIENFNKVVKPGDIVYCLGDCLLGNQEEGLKAIKRLNHDNITFYLAIGNHDTLNKIQQFKNNNIFNDIQIAFSFPIKKRLILLSHFPFVTVTDNDSNRRIFSLHGYTHSTNYKSNIINAYNVGVDAWNCYPINYENLLQKILDK